MNRIRYDDYDISTRALIPRVFPIDRRNAMAHDGHVKHGLKEILRSRCNVNIRIVDANNKPIVFNHGPLIRRQFCLETGLLTNSDFGYSLEYTTDDPAHYTLPREADKLYISIQSLERAIVAKGLAELIQNSKCKLAWYGDAGRFIVKRVPVKLAKDDNLNIYYISESVTTTL